MAKHQGDKAFRPPGGIQVYAASKQFPGVL